MRVVAAYPQHFEFLSQERSGKYLQFIKKCLLDTSKPAYYSVATAHPLATPSGSMYAIKIVEEIENPTLEPIAECWLNGHYFYLWRDKCWAVATDKFGNPISKVLDDNYQWNQAGHTNLVQRGRKALIIHLVGTYE